MKSLQHVFTSEASLLRVLEHEKPVGLCTPYWHVPIQSVSYSGVQ